MKRYAMGFFQGAPAMFEQPDGDYVKVEDVVPREPTPEMLEAVREKPHPTRPDGWADRYAAMWRRMWDAHVSGAAMPPAVHAPAEPTEALFERLHWPHGHGEVSQFRAFKPDPTNLHAPWFLVMPGGASMELNHCADDAIDEARCRWMVDALNRALGVTGAQPAEPVAMALVQEGQATEFYLHGEGFHLPPGEHDLYLAPAAGVAPSHEHQQEKQQ